MARYTYHGPVQTIALAVSTSKDKDGKQVSKFKDFEFVPGTETADLPKGNAIVDAMVATETLLPIGLEPKEDSEAEAAKKAAAEAEKKAAAEAQKQAADNAAKAAKAASGNKGDKQ